MRSFTASLNCLFLISAAVVSGFLSIPVFAQPPSYHFELLSETLHHPYFYDIAVEGDRLYAASGYGLEVMDVSDPAHPVSLGRAPTYGYSYSVEVRDSVAFVLDEDRGSYVFDASNPMDINLIEERIAPELFFEYNRIFDDRLYTCIWTEGVRITDISNPHSPRYLGTFRRGPFPTSIWVQDTIAYVADEFNDVIIIANLTNPARSVFYAQVDLPGFYVRDLMVTDTLLIVALSDNGVRIYGIENPIEPHLPSTLHPNGYAQSLAVYGDALFVAAGSVGVRVYDISDPVNPQEAGDPIHPNKYAAKLFAENERMFISLSSYGWALLDVSEPLAAQEIVYNPTETVIYRVEQVGDALYVPCYGKGMQVVDVSDVRAPRPAALLDTVACSRVQASGDGWLYSTGYSSNDSAAYIYAWDVADPLSPQLAGMSATSTAYGDIALEGDLLVYSDYIGAVELWDVFSRRSPSLISLIPNMPAYSIALQNQKLYVVTSDLQLVVYDVSDPEFPQRCGVAGGFEYGNSVAVAGERAYIGDGNNGVIVYDVSDPASIQRIGVSRVQNWAVEVMLFDSTLYVADAEYGIRVLNPFVPGVPAYLGYLDTPGYTFSCVVRNGICTVADEGDLVICRYLSPGAVRDNAERPEGFGLMDIYPNPTNGFIKTTLTLPSAAKGNLSLVSADGRKVGDWSFEAPTGRRVIGIALPNLPSGSYTLLLEATACRDGRRIIQRRQVELIK